MRESTSVPHAGTYTCVNESNGIGWRAQFQKFIMMFVTTAASKSNELTKTVKDPKLHLYRYSAV